MLRSVELQRVGHNLATEQHKNGWIFSVCAPRGGESVAPGLQPGSPGLQGRQYRRQ